MDLSNRRIGEYVLEARLGAGAFGEVWRGRHHVWTDRLVAVKVPTDPEYVRQLQREGFTVHALHHPGIVQALGFDPFADPAYLMMEYVPGSNLRGFMRGQALPVEAAVSILRQVLAALSYAHGQGVVHRDLKPENILVHERVELEGLDAEGVVKLTDFGLGQSAQQAMHSIAVSSSLDADAARRIVGTIDYMAPEQRTGEAVDGRADLYACGVLLFEMLVGRRPIGIELPSEVDRRIPPALDQVFRRAYTRLELRFPTGAAFLEALPRQSLRVAAPAGEMAAAMDPEPEAPSAPAPIMEYAYRRRESAADTQHTQVHIEDLAPPAAWMPEEPVAVTEEEEPLHERIHADARQCMQAIAKGNVTTGFLARVAFDRLPDWEHGADLGWPEAQWLVGQCYERGLGGYWDLGKAALLYRKAAVQGHARAMVNLGYLLLNGRGVPLNPPAAIRWYGRAGELGNVEAQRRLQTLGLAPAKMNDV